MMAVGDVGCWMLDVGYCMPEMPVVVAFSKDATRKYDGYQRCKKRSLIYSNKDGID